MSRRVFIYGAGKVGRFLHRALRKQGWTVSMRPKRAGPPHRVSAQVVVLAVRDPDIEPTAEQFASLGLVPKDAVVLHVAGALGPEVLDSLQNLCRGTGQMHPLVSFASETASPSVENAHVLLSGSEAACKVGREIAAALGMTGRTIRGIDRAGYHAAAGLVAGGTVGLCHAAKQMLVKSGVSEALVPKLVGPLLRSVADNIERMGTERALTGVIRRGDATGLARHLVAMEAASADHLRLYFASAKLQLEATCALGECSEQNLAELRTELERWRERASSRSP